MKITHFPKRKHPLYWSYHGMLARCYNPNHGDYKSYGGRGIKVVQRWLGEEGFYYFVKDMGERPEGMTLDRVNNNKGYGPKNCRWASGQEQSINRRNSRNTSGAVGVSWHKPSNRWMAYIDMKREEDGKKNRKHLGYFYDIGEAIDARRVAESARLQAEQESSNKE